MAMRFPLTYRWLFAFILTVFAVLYLLNPPFSDEAILKRFFFQACNAAEPLDCWRISRADHRATFWLHKLPNILFSVLGAASLAVVLGSYLYPRLRPYRLPLLVLILSMALCPTAVCLLKQFHWHYCPNQLPEFGGTLPHSARCYPAAHPAAGFAFLALAIAPLRRGWRMAGLCLGLGFGLALSWIQMARGEHAPSHVLATLVLALFIGYSLRCFLLSRRLSFA